MGGRGKMGGEEDGGMSFSECGRLQGSSPNMGPQAGLWASPWPPPFSARPAPSPSASSCRLHSLQWWLQARTRVRPAGGREGGRARSVRRTG